MKKKTVLKIIIYFINFVCYMIFLTLFAEGVYTFFIEEEGFYRLLNLTEYISTETFIKCCIVSIVLSFLVLDAAITAVIKPVVNLIIKEDEKDDSINSDN